MKATRTAAGLAVATPAASALQLAPLLRFAPFAERPSPFGNLPPLPAALPFLPVPAAALAVASAAAVGRERASSWQSLSTTPYR